MDNSDADSEDGVNEGWRSLGMTLRREGAGEEREGLV